MRYEHDCDRCIALGEHEEADLYFCEQAGDPTIIARYGSDGPDYTSGLIFANSDKHLKVAKERAKQRGLLPNK